MPEEVLKEISKLLNGIFVFEEDFKEGVFTRAKTLDNVKLQKLKNILLEVDRWQEIALNKKIQENADFYNKIVNAKKKADQNIVNLYKQKLSADDNKKMEIILDKIRSI